MDTLHLKFKSSSQTDVILDMDAYQNKLTTDQDHDITEYIQKHNLKITSVSCSNVYNDEYILIYNLPGHAKNIKCDSPHLIGRYKSTLMFKPFCGVVNITYSYVQHWIMTYKQKLNINESMCQKICYTNDIIMDIIPNLKCNSLKNCNEIILKANLCSPTYYNSKVYDQLYNNISQTGIKKITIINDNNNIIPSSTDLSNINGITYGYYMKA